MEASEVRAWIQLGFIVVGGLVGLAAFVQNMKQRKIENSLKMTQWFHASIAEDDLSSWHSLFHMASEPAGAKPGFYVKNSDQRPLSDYFSEGSPDSGAVGRVSDCLEVICHEVVSGTVDARFIWFEFGQLLRTIYSWLEEIESPSAKGSLLSSAYPNFEKAFRKFGNKFNEWPSRTYAYVE